MRQEGRITALDRHGQRVGHIGVGHVDRDVGDTINGPEFEAARRGNGRRIVHRLHPNEVFQRFGGDAIGRIDAHRVHPGILAARPARKNAFGGRGGFPLQPFGQGDGLERDGLAHATRAHRNDRGVFLTFDDLHRRGAQEGQGLPIDIHLNLEGAGAGGLGSRGVGDLQLAVEDSGFCVGVRYGGAFGRGPVTEGPGVADAGGASVIRGGREPTGGPGDEVVGREHRGDERRGVGDHQRERIHGALLGHFGAYRTGTSREIGHWAVVTQVLQFPALAIVHPEIVVALANVGRGRVLLRVGHDEAGGLARGLRQVLPNHGPGDPVGGLHVQIGEALEEVPAVHAEGLALVQQGARDAGFQTRIGRAVVAVNTQFAGDGRALCGGHRGEIGVIVEGDFVEDLIGNAELDLVARFQGRSVEFRRINHAVEVVVEADQAQFGHLHLQVMATGWQHGQHGLAAGHGLSVGQLPGHLHGALGPGVVGHHLNLGGLAFDGLERIHAANDRRPILHRNAVVRWRRGASLGIGDGQVEVDDAGPERLRGQIQDLIGHLQPIHGLPEVAQRLRAPGHHGLDEQRIAFQGRLMANALNQRGQGGLVHQADGREVLHPTVGLRNGRRRRESVRKQPGRAGRPAGHQCVFVRREKAQIPDPNLHLGGFTETHHLEGPTAPVPHTGGPLARRRKKARTGAGDGRKPDRRIHEQLGHPVGAHQGFARGIGHQAGVAEDRIVEMDGGVLSERRLGNHAQAGRRHRQFAGQEILKPMEPLCVHKRVSCNLVGKNRRHHHNFRPDPRSKRGSGFIAGEIARISHYIPKGILNDFKM